MSSLFYLAVILLVFSVIINLIAQLIVRRFEFQRREGADGDAPNVDSARRALFQTDRRPRRRRIVNRLMEALAIACLLAAVTVLVSVVVSS